MPGQGNLSDLTDFRYLCHAYNCLKIQTIIGIERKQQINKEKRNKSIDKRTQECYSKTIK